MFSADALRLAFLYATMKFKGVFCVFFDGLFDFEKGAVFCAMDSANAKSNMRPSVKLMLKYYKNGHFDKEGFLKKVCPIVPYASDEEILEYANQAVLEELRRRGLE